jgi:predicted transcriptional regulator
VQAKALGVRWALQLAIGQQLTRIFMFTDAHVVAHYITGSNYVPGIDILSKIVRSL